MTPTRIGEFTIRRAEERDTDLAYHVCLATGDNGRDAGHLYDDPKALGHIYVGPYLKLEPELAFVLEDAQSVCGYILGAVDSRKFYAAYVHDWLRDLRTRHPEPIGEPAEWNASQRAYHEYYHPEIFIPERYEDYPSHLHLDLLPRVQRRGLGAKMMEVLQGALVQQGSAGVHLGLGMGNVRAEKFYKRLGFQELARRADVLYLGRRLA